jgi:hypothetical protein
MKNLLRSDRARSRFALLASIVMLAAQLAFIQHSLGTAHRAGEFCHICVQLDGSAHAPPPAAPPPPELATPIAPAIACLVFIVFVRRSRPAQPRAPPRS